ncbi:hypothetical protein JXB41_05050 [Candidatus Woesearchaeota archaeon]|nr:hypothetical protein [Candidatus Woesearchaeota archaeon]
MCTPQEIEVWYILPALRRELTLKLKKKNLKQKQIASILGVTEAAVSQYSKNKRANSITFNLKINKAIDNAAENMINDKTCHRFELQNLINFIKKSGFLCKVHHKYDTVPKCCTVCINNEKGERKCRSI